MKPTHANKSYYLATEVIELIDKTAEREGRNLKNVIARAIKSYVMTDKTIVERSIENFDRAAKKVTKSKGA